MSSQEDLLDSMYKLSTPEVVKASKMIQNLLGCLIAPYMKQL